MIFSAIRGLKNSGVLGMNRRNAEYIMRYNPRSAFPLVDDKRLTKQLAKEHSIPTPPLYHSFDHHGDLTQFDKALSDLREFVIKPARGGGGSGIILVVDRISNGFINSSGAVISREELVYHIGSTISGIYSLEGLEDRALVETLIHPDPTFDAVTYRGVPDIRIIIYRGVPAMAMVRLPTRASDGKANLHRGAIGAGIGIGNGVTLTAVHRSLVISHHPDTGNPVTGIRVPHWEEILLMSARACEMTGLGYVGVDIVVDRDLGPLLLELNARPGLAVQLANRDGLWGRLERIEKAPPDIFPKPETRVAWAIEAFSSLY